MLGIGRTVGTFSESLAAGIQIAGRLHLPLAKVSLEPTTELVTLGLPTRDSFAKATARFTSTGN
jgi:hypothetical protein